jgi:23S rRNA pseudouridine1911/1915/1917 synthase
MTRLRVPDLEVPPVRPRDVSPDSVVSGFRVPPEASGMRLDRFLQNQLKRTSRTRSQHIIRVSAFSYEGKPLRPSDRVRGGDHVFLWRPPWDEDPHEALLTILYEDAHLLAIDKPAMMPVHPTARYYRSTLVKVLEVMRPNERFYLAHRLDRETSGVILLSKTAEADRAMKRLFAEPATKEENSKKAIKKAYLAIATNAPGWSSVAADEPLELDPTNALRVKMRVATPPEGLYARTRFEVLERRMNHSSGRAYALIACALDTGRQHQIRVHLAHRGHTIVGDKLYGEDDRMFARGADGELTQDDLIKLEMPRHALHAHTIAFDHPIDGSPVAIESPLPEDMRAFWDALVLLDRD